MFYVADVLRWPAQWQKLRNHKSRCCAYAPDKPHSFNIWQHCAAVISGAHEHTHLSETKNEWKCSWRVFGPLTKHGFLWSNLITADHRLALLSFETFHEWCTMCGLAALTGQSLNALCVYAMMNELKKDRKRTPSYSTKWFPQTTNGTHEWKFKTCTHTTNAHSCARLLCVNGDAAEDDDYYSDDQQWPENKAIYIYIYICVCKCTTYYEPW